MWLIFLPLILFGVGAAGLLGLLAATVAAGTTVFAAGASVGSTVK